MEKLKKNFNVSLKFIGSFIIAYLVCVMIDAFCLYGFAEIAHVISFFCLKELMFGVFRAFVQFWFVFWCIVFLMRIFNLYCLKNSIITPLFLIAYSMFGFYNYWEPILIGESRYATTELIQMAQNDAGRYYTLGAWVTVSFAFIFNVIIWFLIWAYSVDGD